MSLAHAPIFSERAELSLELLNTERFDEVTTTDGVDTDFDAIFEEGINLALQALFDVDDVIVQVRDSADAVSIESESELSGQAIGLDDSMMENGKKVLPKSCDRSRPGLSINLD